MEPNAELLFIITPPPAIVEYVAMLKEHVRLAIGHPFEDEMAKAHITLFQYRDERAEDWLYQVDSTISSFAPFHVHVKNLNYHDIPPSRNAPAFAKASADKPAGRGTTRTIYLDVVQKTPICDIVEQLGRPAGEFTPTITIARNLDLNDFLKAWRSLKNLSYSEYFRCDHITVLKKACPEVSRRAPRRWIYYMDLSLAA
jgi:2'-5' RNA ligase